METTLKEFNEIMKEKKLISSNLELIQWDLETSSPKKAKDLLSDIYSYMSMKLYNLTTSDKFKNIVFNLEKQSDDLDDISKKEVELELKSIKKMTSIPSNEYEEYTKLISLTQHKWEEAKAKNNFSLIKEDLKKIFDFNIKFAEYRKENQKNLYDVLLDDYEKDLTCEQLDIFFAELKNKIVPLLKEIKNKNISNTINLSVAVENQSKLSNFIASYVGFDFERGILAESEHPFTLHLNKNDVRITTKYIESNPISSIFSTIHESGHAIYEQNVDDSLAYSILGNGTSMGIHESQSRLFENVIGRNISFWKPIYSELQNLYSDLKTVDLSDFYKSINSVDTTLIRTESDELTYSLHIMLRYEIERDLINKKISVEDLPKIWAEKMQEYLGVVPKTDTEGVLQDVHWFCGLIGYFPSYSIGTALSSQIYKIMEKDLDIEKILLSKDLSPIVEWLSEKIYKFGSLKDSNQIIKDVTGEDLNSKYYTEYLKEKYKKIYML